MARQQKYLRVFRDGGMLAEIDLGGRIAVESAVDDGTRIDLIVEAVPETIAGLEPVTEPVTEVADLEVPPKPKRKAARKKVTR